MLDLQPHILPPRIRNTIRSGPQHEFSMRLRHPGTVQRDGMEDTATNTPFRANDRANHLYGGFSLFNGQTTANPEAKSAQGGYRINLPTLRKGWDMYGALASSDSHTNQKPELITVIHVLQIVRVRKMQSAKIVIFTNSKYGVQGLNEAFLASGDEMAIVHP